MSLKIQDGEIISRYVIVIGIHSYCYSPMYASNNTQFIPPPIHESVFTGLVFAALNNRCVANKQSDVAM